MGSKYAKEVKAGTPKDACMPMVRAALLTTARRWKQRKCPSTGERYIHTVKYWSALKRGVLT